MNDRRRCCNLCYPEENIHMSSNAVTYKCLTRAFNSENIYRNRGAFRKSQFYDTFDPLRLAMSGSYVGSLPTQQQRGNLIAIRSIYISLASNGLN